MFYVLCLLNNLSEMKSYWPYPIGTPGVAWSPEEK